MSSRVVAKILPVIKDLTVFKEVLESKNFVTQETSKSIFLSREGISFTILDNGTIRARFNNQNRRANGIIDDIVKEYQLLYQKKLAELRRKLDTVKRAEALQKLNAQNHQEQEEQQLERELRKMEKTRKIEQKLLQDKITQIEQKIIERAEANGFTVKKTVGVQKQVIRLVRRK